MRALIKKTSDWEYEKVKEVDSIEDILKIHPRVVLEKIDGEYVTLFGDKFKDCDIKIEIYDDYRE